MVIIEHVEDTVDFVGGSSQCNVKNIRFIKTLRYLRSYFWTWQFNGLEKFWTLNLYQKIDFRNDFISRKTRI